MTVLGTVSRERHSLLSLFGKSLPGIDWFFLLKGLSFHSPRLPRSLSSLSTRRQHALLLSLPSSDSDEKYIVLIFENGLTMQEQMILEEILVEIGKTNNLNEFPTKLSFDEANSRLVNYNKTTKEKVCILRVRLASLQAAFSF